jgi:hypothetical protein
MKFEIKNRWSGALAYSCKLSAEVAGQSYGLQLGFAIKAAVADDANLRDANLSGADLRGADLRDADLRGADLRDADLSGANLRDANLRGADLRDADLRGADLRDADLRGANLRDANLSGADLRDADLRKCPVIITGIHSAVYAAAAAPGSLEMGSWHACDTTHCRAGWVVHLAGPGGAALEYVMGTPAAAALIYMASDPTLKKIPDFYCDNETALADMKRLAELEATAKEE